MRLQEYGGIPDWQCESLARDMLTRYFNARDQEDLQTRNFSQTSWRIANLQVGESAVFISSSLQLLRQRFPSARKIAGNSSMVFRCETLSRGIKVVRLPDGSPLKRDPLANPKVRELVSLEVGQKLESKAITSTRGAGYLGSNSKVMARRYLKSPEAQWTVYREGDKIIVERTK